MNHHKYRFLLVLISAVILITLGIQSYWVFKNYKESERQLERDIRTSFDLSVEDYYTTSAKRNTLSFFNEANEKWSESEFDSLLGNITTFAKKAKSSKKNNVKIDSIIPSQKGNDWLSKTPAENNIKAITVFKGLDADTAVYKKNEDLNLTRFFKSKSNGDSTSNAKVTNMSFTDDSEGLLSGQLKEVSDKIIFSFTTNVLDLESLDSLMSESLEKNNIDIEYGFKYNDGEDDFEVGNIAGSQVMDSKSPQLYKNTNLKLIYQGQEATLFKRNLVSILLSFILVCGIILCLFYLLFIIRKQKQLSLIKNDLISNITHEFKTPIATASAALEGVQNFTVSGDTEKSNRYLNVGREQLGKLNLMVEKLLETAMIDNERLALQKTRFDLKMLLKESVKRFQSQTQKNIQFESDMTQIDFYGDEFHMENAINNLMDNAIKYGGNNITATISKKGQSLIIKIIDDGTQLNNRNAKNLFEKFYRVTDGNKHHTKGHGIGLFYTKAIIEKHNGTINLTLKPTTFTIELPHE
ncbi:sensor histidine kinase [Nonlabens agnitus]|uniref:histidine kinase n=1 Tax=Nonlabens agnitus TaxID=870484 RepID=A0A2S9WVD4_9FLAO|nr:HAMP domain-containing sensor histidine kinase [Nonlabens agnitus]PRP67447.1 hypothetical protein BST86_10255 [Nonlabens agnitus]